MVGRFGEVYVMDWGLACVLEESEPAPTEDATGDSITVIQADRPPPSQEAMTLASRSVLGTPRYIPPEQAAGLRSELDQRADIYAVGAMLYEMLAGQPPYAAAAQSGTRTALSAVLHGPPEPLGSLAPDAPPALVAIVERAMARLPADRYPTAEAVEGGPPGVPRRLCGCRVQGQLAANAAVARPVLQVSTPPSTCWTVIEAAASGSDAARAAFADTYLPVVQAYLRARWRGSVMSGEVDDACQEVFIDMLREQGALGRADRERGGFRPYLFGVVRNVARYFESRRNYLRTREHQPAMDLHTFDAREEELGITFDKAWARALIHEATGRMRDRAYTMDAEAQRRLELLELRFQEGVPIREIASRWSLPPEQVHRAYARARREFRSVLIEVVSFHMPHAIGVATKEATRLIDLLA